MYTLLVAAAFELLTRAALNAASLGPFEIRDLSPVQKALPVIASYLYYDIGTMGMRGGYVTEAYLRILKLQHPDFAKRDLLVIIWPHRSSLIAQRMFDASWSGLHARLGRAMYALISLSIPFWLIYAFSALFHRFHVTDVTVWVSLTISFLFVVLGVTVSLTAFENAGHTADDGATAKGTRGNDH
jgi:hypothetical protein